jgi:hypothetical protein
MSKERKRGALVGAKRSPWPVGAEVKGRQGQWAGEVNWESPEYERKEPRSNFRSWRLLTYQKGKRFDEIVIRLSAEQCIHLETLSSTSMYLDIAGQAFWLFRQHGVWCLRGPEARLGRLIGVDEDVNIRKYTGQVKGEIRELLKRRRVLQKKLSKQRKEDLVAVKRELEENVRLSDPRRRYLEGRLVLLERPEK